MKETKNIQLPSLEQYPSAKISIQYQRPQFDTMAYINSSATAVKYLRMFISEAEIDHKEYFWLLLLNRANRLLAFAEIGIGSDVGVVVNYKEIFQMALLTNASALIVAHNHPSGQLTPSKADQKETQAIQKMAKVLSFQLLDHLIITSESFTSISDEGLM